MPQEVAVTELIDVECPQEDALAVLWAIQTIEQTEVKVDTVQVIPDTVIQCPISGVFNGP